MGMNVDMDKCQDCGDWIRDCLCDERPSECFYCGGYSEYPHALCNECFEAHKAKACEARPGFCDACNIIEMEGQGYGNYQGYTNQSRK